MCGNKFTGLGIGTMGLQPGKIHYAERLDFELKIRKMKFANGTRFEVHPTDQTFRTEDVHSFDTLTEAIRFMGAQAKKALGEKKK